MFVSGNQREKNIGAFKSVNDVIAEIKLPTEMVKFSVGGYYGVHADFTRIPGKKIVTSTTTQGGRMLSIHQLDFSDRPVLIYHSSTGYYTGVSSEFVQLRISVASVSILGPIIAPP